MNCFLSKDKYNICIAVSATWKVKDCEKQKEMREMVFFSVKSNEKYDTIIVTRLETRKFCFVECLTEKPDKIF